MFSAPRNSVYMDMDDLVGGMNRLLHRIEAGGDRTPYYVGAYATLSMMRGRLHDADEFMGVLDSYLDNHIETGD